MQSRPHRRRLQPSRSLAHAATAGQRAHASGDAHPACRSQQRRPRSVPICGTSVTAGVRWNRARQQADRGCACQLRPLRYSNATATATANATATATAMATATATATGDSDRRQRRRRRTRGGRTRGTIARSEWGRRSSPAEGGTPRERGPARSRFNGAAGLHRRRDHRELRGFAELVDASMGPPVFTGGGMASFARHSLRPALQWGRRSSPAEGRPRVCGAPEHVAVASMGPPVFTGGRSADVAPIARVGSVASMGPPVFTGGREYAHFADNAHKQLQWGRRSSPAEGAQSAVALVKALDASMGPPVFTGGRSER